MPGRNAPESFGGDAVYAILTDLARGEREREEDEVKRRETEARIKMNQMLAELYGTRITEAEASEDTRLRGEHEKQQKQDAIRAEAEKAYPGDPAAQAAYYNRTFLGTKSPESYQTAEEKSAADLARAEADAEKAGVQAGKEPERLEAEIRQKGAAATASEASAESARATAAKTRAQTEAGEADPLAGLNTFQRQRVQTEVDIEAQEYIKRHGGAETALARLDEQYEQILQAFATGDTAAIAGFDPTAEPDSLSFENIYTSYLLLRAALQREMLRESKKENRGTSRRVAPPSGAGGILNPSQ
jgi:hypothetical protein